MGGNIIVKRLRTILGPAASFHFYDDGNGRPELLWASFCSDVEKNAKENVEVICATPSKYFMPTHSWLAEPLIQKGNC